MKWSATAFSIQNVMVSDRFLLFRHTVTAQSNTVTVSSFIYFPYRSDVNSVKVRKKFNKKGAEHCSAPGDISQDIGWIT